MPKVSKVVTPEVVDVPWGGPPEPEEIRTWRALDNAIMQTSEARCWELLDYEKEHQARYLFLTRIYGRAQVLRGKREQLELRRSAKDREV